MYFAFLSSYTRSLSFISAAGAGSFLLGQPYSVYYSLLLFFWSVVTVEGWRVQERIFSVRWGTQGAFRVEKQRTQYVEGFAWWKKDLKMLGSVPVILLFAGVMFTLLTSIFVLEAFVAALYTGPGHQYIVSSRTTTNTGLSC